MPLLDEKIHQVKQKLKKEFLADSRPWVVTFSGGKDSSTVLHLTIDMVMELKNEGSEIKKIYIVMSDTGVEMPLIEDYAIIKLSQIQSFIDREKLNIDIIVLKPKVTESFWTLLLGKGYPSPNQNFRWCTDRMKIKPATFFLKNLTEKCESIVMLLGVRSDESQSRAQSIEKRELNHRGFNKHSEVPNAFTFSPIKDWTNAEVWTFLSTTPAPWGDHTDMMKLYDKGSGEADCNIALNPEAATCGKTRFGCWVCTVVSKDKSMENMLRNPEDHWMEPLHHFRNKLEEYRQTDSGKRQARRRNGQKWIGHEDKAIGPFLLTTRQELLGELLEIEKELITQKKLGDKYLISTDEIIQIQQEWLHDGDFFETAIKLARNAGRIIPYNSTKSFNHDEQLFIQEVCNKYSVPSKLIEDLMQTEHSYRHQVKRMKLFTEMEALVESHALGKINEI